MWGFLRIIAQLESKREGEKGLAMVLSMRRSTGGGLLAKRGVREEDQQRAQARLAGAHQCMAERSKGVGKGRARAQHLLYRSKKVVEGAREWKRRQ